MLVLRVQFWWQKAEMTTQVELQKNELPKDMMKDMMIDKESE
jgi:hypothetical protein